MGLQTNIKVCASDNAMYDEDVYNAYFPPQPLSPPLYPDEPQVTSPELAKVGIHSKRLHLKALINSLHYIWDGLYWTKHRLELYNDPDPRQWEPDHHDDFAQLLTTSVILLEGLLDGLMILVHSTPSRNITFQRKRFPDDQMRKIQYEILEYKSVGKGSDLYTDFWSIANFWKHYFPYHMIPSMESRTHFSHDVYVKLSQNVSSGPIMYDLFVPVYNATRLLIMRMCELLEMEEPIIADELKW